MQHETLPTMPFHRHWVRQSTDSQLQAAMMEYDRSAHACLHCATSAARAHPVFGRSAQPQSAGVH